MRVAVGTNAWSHRAFGRSLGSDPDQLADWWSSRPSKWFLGAERIRLLKERSVRPGSLLESVIDRADRVRHGEMPLFARHGRQFTGTERWSYDPVLRRTAPRVFYSDVPYLDPQASGDAKVVWEPNRFQWALWLGLAYLITGKVEYVETFLDLTNDWFEMNPYPIGINYASALEVGLRLYSWIWSLHLFESCWAKHPDVLHRLLSGVWIGARHIENNLSYYFSPNTHLTGEAFSLFACGAAIPEFAESNRWIRLGQRILAEEAVRQFFEDGTHRECSSGYHLYSADFYLQTVLIAQRTGVEARPEIVDAARRSTKRLAELVPRDLVLPQFNDCDGGRLTFLCEEALDAAPTLFTASFLFGDADLAHGEREPCGYCLLMGPTAGLSTPTTTMNRSPSGPKLVGYPSSDLPDSGIVAYRNFAGDFLLFRASPFGYGGSPHSHDATLSVIVMLAGEPVIVDAGVGSYTRSLSIRNSFRSAPASNSIVVDGHGASLPGGWFDWISGTDSSLQIARRMDCGVVCSGGCKFVLSRGSGSVSVRRTVWLLDEGSVVIQDDWNSDVKVALQGFFTLDSRTTADSGQQILSLPSGLTVHYGSDSAQVSSRSKLIGIPVPYSPAYGEVVTSRALLWSASRSASGRWTTFLSRTGPIDDLFLRRIEALLSTCAESVAT